MLAALLTLSCTKSPTASTAKTCSELGDSLIAAAGISVPAYKVISPNGGEVYHVGDTLHIRATGNLKTGNNDVVELKFRTAAGIKFVEVPHGTSGSVNLYNNCDMAFAIPDSLPSLFGSGKVALVSDSVKVLVQNYTDNTYRDTSDGYFQIKAHTP